LILDATGRSRGGSRRPSAGRCCAPLSASTNETYWDAIGAVVAPRRGPAASPEAQRPLPTLGPEAEALLVQPGAIQWLRKAMFNENGRVALYRDAEDRLRRWGA